MAMLGRFDEEYKKLNKAQKEAVEALDGPVMVVAGPGTGKTQILSLRIANILKKTDIKPDGILCLTFTNSGVSAMKERLVRYLGETGEKVNVFTFHSFGMKIVEEYYKVLGLESVPRLLDDAEISLMFDEVLRGNEWEYLRPRGDQARYFADLKSLISLLKRERVSQENFLGAVNKEIKFLENDEESISTRGESKGTLKKEVEKEIEGLGRSREVAKFIELYEKTKKEKNVLDYDDVLENLVKIVESSDEVVSEIRERYLYILIDEHQDSSRVQNEFIKKVWGKVERPDIFVVGDDRQLIYGFSGASIDHFKGFQETFKGAKLITLVDNYRSTQVILDASHALLQSVMSEQKLLSQSKEHHPIELVEALSEEAEISAVALDLKEKIKKGLNPNDVAILVPKNKQVRNALEVLHRAGLPVSSLEALNLFDQEDGQAFIRVLKIISDTEDRPAFALSFFDSVSLIDPLEAHKFISAQNMREFSFEKVLNDKSQKLFSDYPKVENWLKKLKKWHKDSQNNDLQSLLEIVGKELFLDSKPGDTLVSGGEILNTVLLLFVAESEKNPDITLALFVYFLDKLESYGEHIPIVASEKEGVKVLTMHSAKGLEFDYVWIAHLDEKSLNGGKRTGFSLPESIKELIEERDVDSVKRKLYVAITRAKRFCTLSYSLESSRGSEREVASVIADLPPEILHKRNAHKIKEDRNSKEIKNNYLPELAKLVAEKYPERYVSASLLNNFFECPWKWYFRNILQLPEPENESLVFGNKVHQALDQILKERKLIMPADKEVAKVISIWAKRRLAEISEDRKSEQSFSISLEKFPQLKIYGRIDLVEKLPDGVLRLTDFKTGNVRRKSDIEKLDEEERPSNYLRQLTMYAFLSRAREGRLDFVEAKNSKEIFYDRKIGEDEINLLIKDITDYDELVKSGEWVERKCHFNSYGKDTECEYCKMGEIYG